MAVVRDRVGAEVASGADSPSVVGNRSLWRVFLLVMYAGTQTMRVLHRYWLIRDEYAVT